MTSLLALIKAVEMTGCFKSAGEGREGNGKGIR
jgi:hypothetical protein